MTDAQPPILKVALVQMCSGRSIADNLAQAERLIRAAALEGAHYIQTPENTALMELDPHISKLEARQYDASSVLAAFRALASELKVCLHIGSVSIHQPDNNRLLNRSCLINPAGRIIAHYDKIHMFDVDLPNGESYRESDRFTAGSNAVLADLPTLDGPAVKLGFTICYDLRFPALFRGLAQAGAQIIAVPAAFTEQTGKAHWHVLLRARAIETGCYILAAAQGRAHENGRSTYGHSLIISPWGEIIAEADTKPQILMAELDLTAVERARAQIPALRHDRSFKISEISLLEQAEGQT